MTDVANPERMLFASTTQSFLEKEASLSRLRELHAAGTSFEADWWRRAAELGWTSLLVPEELGGGSVSGDGVADLALVAELVGKTVAPGPLHPVSTVLAGLVEAPENHEDDNRIAGFGRDRGVVGRLRAGQAVVAPGRRRSPRRGPRPAIGSTVSRIASRRAPRARSCWWWRSCDGAVRQFLVPTDAPGVRSSRSGRSTW